MRIKSVGLIAVAILILEMGSFGQETKAFLTPAEIVKILSESKTSYVINSIEKLKPEETRDLPSALFPARYPPPDQPRVEWKNGNPLLGEYKFTKKAVALINKAEKSFAEKDYEKARLLYAQALEADPDCYLAMAYIGDCYLNSGRPEKALAEYERAILKNPSDHRLFFFRGHALMILGRAEDGWRDWIHALMLRPRYPYVLQVINSPTNPFKKSIRESLFLPPVLVRKEGSAIGIYADINKGGAHWLAYANAKAVWLGEPSHRKAMIGKTDASWSMTEERECLGNLMAVYEEEVSGKKIEPDPDLEAIKRIVEAGDLDPFLLYEVYSRVCPPGMLTLSEETQRKVEQYIQKYLVTPKP
jgi:tetratricopeptide (TPR) repeat protein